MASLLFLLHALRLQTVSYFSSEPEQAAQNCSHRWWHDTRYKMWWRQYLQSVYMAFEIKTWKNISWEEIFCLSGFWAFGAFSENLLNPWQRASVKASTVTRPQTMLVALLLQPQLHCGTARHSLSPGLRKCCEWGRRSPLQPLHWAAGPASPTHHCTLSSAFPAHLLVPSSHPRTARCQQMQLGGLPKCQTPLWTAAVKPGSAAPLAGTCCQQCSFYYQNR